MLLKLLGVWVSMRAVFSLLCDTLIWGIDFPPFGTVLSHPGWIERRAFLERLMITIRLGIVGLISEGCRSLLIR